MLSKKANAIVLLVMTISLLLMGVFYGLAAKRYLGTKIGTGAMINGNVQVTNTGYVGRDMEKYRKYKNGQIIFFCISGVTGIGTIVAAISCKKK